MTCPLKTKPDKLDKTINEPNGSYHHGPCSATLKPPETLSNPIPPSKTRSAPRNHSRWNPPDMQLEETFTSKKDAKFFIADKSVREKKPFVVERSDPRRLEVVCPVEGCLFRLNVRARKDDLFTSRKVATNTHASRLHRQSK